MQRPRRFGGNAHWRGVVGLWSACRQTLEREPVALRLTVPSRAGGGLAATRLLTSQCEPMLGTPKRKVVGEALSDDPKATCWTGASCYLIIVTVTLSLSTSIFVSVQVTSTSKVPGFLPTTVISVRVALKATVA